MMSLINPNSKNLKKKMRKRNLKVGMKMERKMKMLIRKRMEKIKDLTKIILLRKMKWMKKMMIKGNI